ncbi:type I restriction endonuclease subunit R [Thermoanaerobacterium thermosaccharolyticum]|uniref:type I restriction endonuclease subunit R n=1 Tax=Thermoanaerobacterium thermosaccharolyticum TaxID=1517 RepID=UPI003DA7C257
MSKTLSDLTEKSFEEYVEDQLISNEYLKGNPKDYDKQYAFDVKMLFNFLWDTQPEKMEKLKNIHKDQFEYKLITRLNNEINNRGLIDVLRHGIKDYGVYLDMVYFKPASTLNADMVELYNKNILSVTRQVHYSLKNDYSVDMVIFINGIPVVVLEFKNAFTGQTVQNAVEQYRNDRSPSEILFKINKRAIVYFAVDTDEVYMTTKIDGKNTIFLPFNKGNNGGRGNPDNPNGLKTSYLWDEVLQKDSLLEIIQKFIFVKTEDYKDDDGKINQKKTFIFPRYHQLDAVRKIENQVLLDGVGHNYLIMHSAGSGKTNTISWLAYRLSSIHNKNNETLFDSVIVITDRRVLDMQLQDNIYQLEHKFGVVQKIDKDSNQLAEALKNGTKIIISTLQKFPFILEKIGELGNRNYAVIIDEAHSSTAGSNMSALKEALHVKSLEEAEEIDDKLDEYDPEDEILKQIKKQGRQPNISFFAFTATPKAKTLEMFGTIGDDGKPHPFHVYSMRQAIEEGFILDVLKNYVTYQTYFKITKKIEEDPAFDKAKATKALTNYISLHPYNIAQKVKIIIEHFRNITMHKIGGKAKAMVVTSSRLHAVRYKKAFDEYIKLNGYTGIKALVAFTGTVIDDGLEFTEPQMNNMRETELPEKFDTDEYQVLIVAEKYQTGFDQPLLHTMFVDKKLSGVKAVQTLSRLNRICKGKDDTFILDFVNKAEDIQNAFKPYYESATVEDVTDPNLLYDLQTELEAFKIYQKEELDKFVYIYFKPKDKRTLNDRAKMNSIIDIAIDRYIKLENNDEKIAFSKKAEKYTRLYSFLLQITPFEDVELHKLYIYLTYLIRKLPKNARYNINLIDEVALEYYKIKETFNGDISLNEKGVETALKGIQFTGSVNIEKKEHLSAIIEDINKRYGTDFTKADQLSIEQLKEDSYKDEELKKQAKVNSIDDFKLEFEKKFTDKVIERMDQNQSFFTKILDNEDLKKTIIDYLAVEIYKIFRNEIVHNGK